MRKCIYPVLEPASCATENRASDWLAPRVEPRLNRTLGHPSPACTQRCPLPTGNQLNERCTAQVYCIECTLPSRFPYLVVAGGRLAQVAENHSRYGSPGGENRNYIRILRECVSILKGSGAVTIHWTIELSILIPLIE